MKNLNLNTKLYIGIATVLIIIAVWLGISSMSGNDKNVDKASEKIDTSLLGCAVGNVFNTETGERCPVVKGEKPQSAPVLSTLTPKPLAPAKAYADISTDWVWVKPTYTKNGWAPSQPVKEGDFTLKINENKTFSVSGDCNSTTGGYSISESTISGAETPDELVLGKITVTPGVSTLKYCQFSVERPFLSDLYKATSYNFRAGELNLMLQNNQGMMKFMRKVNVQS